MVSVNVEMIGQIGWLWLDTPARHNALDKASWQSITARSKDIESSAARVLIIAGKGQSFCAGADISEFDVVRKNAESAAKYEQSNADAFAAIANLSIPTIAAIDGYCLGGGFGIAAACDIRLATHRSSFAVPAAKLGLAYPVEAMRDIVAAIGEQNTKRLMFTAERFSAAQMLEMGFLSQISEDVLKEADTLAHKISKLAPLTHKATKAAIEATTSGDTGAAERLGNATFTSTDYAEGRAAFKEKRAPKFQGN